MRSGDRRGAAISSTTLEAAASMRLGDRGGGAAAIC